MSTSAQAGMVGGPVVASRPMIRLGLSLAVCCGLALAGWLEVDGAVAWLLAALGVLGLLGLAAPWLRRSVEEASGARWLARLAAASAVMGVVLHRPGEAPLVALAGSAALLAAGLAQIALPRWLGFDDRTLPSRAPSQGVVALAVVAGVASLLLGDNPTAALQRAVAIGVFADPVTRAWSREAVDAVLRRKLVGNRVPGVDAGVLEALAGIDRLGIPPSLLANDAGVPWPGIQRFLEELAGFGIAVAGPDLGETAPAELLPGGVGLRVGVRSIPLKSPGLAESLRLLDLARAVAWRREQGMLWIGILQGGSILLGLAGVLGPAVAVAVELGALLYALLNAKALDHWRSMQQPRIAAIVVRTRCGGA